MKTCKRLLDFIQIINAEGDVRACGWNQDNIIGNLQTDDMQTILNSDKAKELRRMIADGDFSKCPSDNCPYQANGNMDDILVDYDESKIQYPESLLLAYEGNCNYACTCCTSYQHMVDTRTHDYRAMYDSLEEKLRPILPYVKRIGANGRGEIFASPRIMRLLGEWRPIAPSEEVSVSIETNGSLFNEKNWKKIENLGQYHLTVAITVMSFQEEVYQYLSGTNQSIEALCDNLRFVKGLREQGIIDKLELATVMQEANFREMPEFTRRCMEEFGADRVRIRPIFPGGIYTKEIQWFMDVRNSEHPYYGQYQKMMEHPIFKDPHVLLWSNNLPSEQGKYPGALEIERLSEISKKQNAVLDRIKRIAGDEELPNRVKAKINGREIAIYGLGAIGKVFVSVLEKKIKIKMIFDKKKEQDSLYGIPIRGIEDAKKYDGVIIVTPYGFFDEMKEEAIKAGFLGEAINIDSFLLE